MKRLTGKHHGPVDGRARRPKRRPLPAGVPDVRGIRSNPADPKRYPGALEGPRDAWNPRYVAYATANGRTPEKMLEHDREAWPGGIMAGFQLYIAERWREWREANGRHRDDYVSDADHASFDEMIGAVR